MREMLTELRHALRALRGRPAFALTVVATVALGVGATTAVFSVVRGVLLAPLPFEEPGRLVAVWEDHSSSGGLEHFSVSWLNYRDFREETEVFEELGAQFVRAFNLTGAGRPEVVPGLEVDAGFFPVLGRRAALGRTLTGEDHREGASPVAVLSHALWRSRFGADPGIVGREIRLSGEPHTVVGVMPRDFRTPRILRDVAGDARLWTPLELPEAWRTRRSASVLQVVGRLADGVTVEAARARMEALAASLDDAHPATNRQVGTTVVPLRAQLVGDVRPTLLLLFAAVGALLLVATANLAGLFLARGASRFRELSVRTALGATRGRLVRHVLAETLLLAMVGGAAGVALAAFGVDALLALAPGDLPRAPEVGVAPGVLVFALALTAVVGVVSGLVPGVVTTRREPRAVLQREASRGDTGQRPGRGPAVVVQLALALALLSGAGLMARSLLALHRVDPGFTVDGVLTFRLRLPESEYPDASSRMAFFDDLFRRFESLPRVEAVGGASRLPLDPAYGWAEVRREGEADVGGDPPVVGARVVSPGYLEALEIPLLEGRLPDRRDDADAPPVILVNRRMARSLWPGESPVGRRVTLGSGGSGPPTWFEVVGVVDDVAHEELGEPPIPELYLPMRQNPPGGTRVVVRAAGAARGVLPALREELRALDPRQPIAGVETMEERVADSMGTARFLSLLLGIFAAAALFLGCLGVYGVVAHDVALRRREVGVRAAMGATPRQVLGLLLRRGGLLIVIGLAAGGVLSLGAGRLLAGHLDGVGGADPVALTGAAIVLGCTGLLATWLPARRAVAVDPAEVLREE